MKSRDVYISSGGKNDPQTIDCLAYPDWQRAPGIMQYQAEHLNAAGQYAESGLVQKETRPLQEGEFDSIHGLSVHTPQPYQLFN